MTLAAVPVAAAAAPPPAAAVDRPSLLEACRVIADTQLRPLAPTIDKDGHYPAEILRSLGAAGAFAQHLRGHGYNRSQDHLTAIEAMSIAGTECGCTSFLMWLQNAFGWYLEVSENSDLRERLQPAIAAGTAFGTSGMSNPVKAMDGIENFKLRGEKVAGGYIVSGVLPYVSNLGDGHYMGTAFELADTPGHRVMCVLHIDGQAVKISPNVQFICLEGSGTYTVIVKKAFVPESMILADPLPPYIKKVKPTFFLLQAGIALGQIKGCISLMHGFDRTHLHVNQYLPKRPDYYEEQVAALLPRLVALLANPFETAPDYLKAVYQLRLDAGELALDCAQSALLHAGAKGYIKGSDADRRFRETLFVAIVTPATKHLRKSIADLSAA